MRNFGYYSDFKYIDNLFHHNFLNHVDLFVMECHKVNTRLQAGDGHDTIFIFTERQVVKWANGHTETVADSQIGDDGSRGVEFDCKGAIAWIRVRWNFKLLGLCVDSAAYIKVSGNLFGDFAAVCVNRNGEFM